MLSGVEKELINRLIMDLNEAQEQFGKGGSGDLALRLIKMEGVVDATIRALKAFL